MVAVTSSENVDKVVKIQRDAKYLIYMLKARLGK